MNVAAEHISLDRGEHSRPAITIQIRVATPEMTMPPIVPVTDLSPLSPGDSTGTEGVKTVTKMEPLDWSDISLHERFAALERKLGRGAANEAEQARYYRMRNSRRAFIKEKSYLADYLETERQKAIGQKLKELQSLLRPISL